jgi:hypothetical protein
MRNTKKHKNSKLNSRSKKNRTLKKYKKKDFIFNKKDYKSGDGMSVAIWGPAQWHFLHMISFNYPVNPTEQQKKQYRDYVLSLQNILPCGACRKNLTNNFKHLPLTMKDMKNRDTFSRYIYELHEHINRMLHKKSGLSYCDVRERYEHFRARCSAEKPKIYKLTDLNHKNKHNDKELEKGCTEPLYGTKSRCILKIVPQKQDKGQSIQIDKKCMKSRKNK